jgi:hypothetical protein
VVAVAVFFKLVELGELVVQAVVVMETQTLEQVQMAQLILVVVAEVQVKVILVALVDQA